MAQSAPVTVKPELIVWGRRVARIPQSIAAKRAGVSIDQFQRWESGEQKPTVKQLRALANIYKVPFGAFYLPTPPQSDLPEPKDFRRFSPQGGQQDLSPELWLEFRKGWNRRLALLDILTDQRVEPPSFNLTASVNDAPEAIGEMLRTWLGMSYEVQVKWREHRKGFNWIRDQLYAKGVLAFQMIDVPLDEVRGYAIAATQLPVIAVNRKDSHAARLFSIFHELTHVLLRATSISNYESSSIADSTSEGKVEAFCNHVAGSTLVPLVLLSDSSVVRKHGSDAEWTDDEIGKLSRDFVVSREVVVRRLLIAGKTTKEFYQAKREQYLAEGKKRHDGFKESPRIDPAVTSVSASGKAFARMLLDALDADRLTPGDVAAYLEVKVGKLEKIAELVAV